MATALSLAYAEAEIEGGEMSMLSYWHNTKLMWSEGLPLDWRSIPLCIGCYWLGVCYLFYFSWHARGWYCCEGWAILENNKASQAARIRLCLPSGRAHMMSRCVDPGVKGGQLSRFSRALFAERGMVSPRYLIDYHSFFQSDGQCCTAVAIDQHSLQATLSQMPTGGSVQVADLDYFAMLRFVLHTKQDRALWGCVVIGMEANAIQCYSFERSSWGFVHRIDLDQDSDVVAALQCLKRQWEVAHQESSALHLMLIRSPSMARWDKAIQQLFAAWPCYINPMDYFVVQKNMDASFVREHPVLTSLVIGMMLWGRV